MSIRISLSHRNISLASIIASLVMLIASIVVALGIYLQSQKSDSSITADSPNPQLDSLNQAFDLVISKTIIRN